MRTVALNGPKARYARLTMMARLAERGLLPAPSSTAPFSLAVEDGKVVILMDRSRIAVVDPSGPSLIIRDEYPVRFDYALIRAVRAVSEMVEEMNRRIKEERGFSSGLITRTLSPHFRIYLGRDEMAKGLIALESMEPRIVAKNEGEDDFSLSVRINEQFAHVRIVNQDGHYVVINDRRAPYKTFLAEGPFRTAIERGVQIWEERFSADEFGREIGLIRPLGDVDLFTVNTVFSEELRAGRVKVHHELIEGKFSVTADMSGDGSPSGIACRYRGFRICTVNDAGVSDGSDAFRCVCPELYQQSMKAAMSLNTRWMAEAAGIDLTSVPLISKKLISDKLEKMDLGYEV